MSRKPDDYGDVLRDRAKDEKAEQRAKEIPKLMARWRNKSGGPMPIEIASMPLEKIRKAVRLVEGGAIVGVPQTLSLGDPRRVSECSEDSMMDYDTHGHY